MKYKLAEPKGMNIFFNLLPDCPPEDFIDLYILTSERMRVPASFISTLFLAFKKLFDFSNLLAGKGTFLFNCSSLVIGEHLFIYLLIFSFLLQ